MGIGAFSLAVSTQALAQVKAKPAIRRPIVVIDPGHGGIDPGCIAWSGAYEKDVALETAQEIARQLEATHRFKAVLTRNSDDFIPLRERVVRARNANGDLFLSIHADAIPDNSVRGASVFTLSDKASDAEAAALASRENKADIVAGIDLSRQTPEVSNILLDLARRQTSNLSIGLAREIVGKLGHEIRMLENSHRSAGFAVLKAPDIPSALIELGCLSNREEDRLLRTATYQRKVAGGIVSSVDAFFTVVARA
jgi:N-acetylmuramoyl-L-alanine amidase